MRVRPGLRVLERELVRIFRQRTRLVSAIVRPLIWLFVIGAGFGAVIGEARGMDYQGFLVPGVLGMTMLFGGMLAALTTVYDKESGVMRMMIIAPMPHAWIVIAKVVSAAAPRCCRQCCCSWSSRRSGMQGAGPTGGCSRSPFSARRSPAPASGW
jgi:ABC-type transport system involved in cytochrome c biogenesis permease component